MPEDTKLDQFFEPNAEPRDITIIPPERTVVAPAIDPDFLESQKNIKSLISQGMMSFSELAQIAATSQKARDYEVLKDLLQTMMDANRSLVDFNREQKLEEEPEKVDVKNQTNILFYGSSADLLAHMQPNPDEDD